MKAARPVRRGADGKVLRQCGVTRRRPTLHGAYLYLTASGAPHQMERGKSAMMTALAGIVLALVAYGVVELVMNAVVDPGIEVDEVLPEPQAPGGGDSSSSGSG